MSYLGFNPSISQGNLNRIATHVVVPSYPALAVSAGYMGKQQAQVTIEGPSTTQIPTATGFTNSPEPFVMAQVVINLLRSQSLAATWFAQFQSQCYLGNVVTFSDSTVFPSITIPQCSIIDFDPGPYDGQDPTVKVTVKGIFYVNSMLWSSVTGSSGLLSAAT